MPNCSTHAPRLLVTGTLVAAALVAYPLAAGRQASPAQAAPAASAPAKVDTKAVIDQYCISCHSERMKQGGLVLEKRDYAKMGDDAEAWEKVVRKLKAGMMPPLSAGSRRPDPATHAALISSIEGALDKAVGSGNPGRPPIHRLNRSEYTNAIRDIFGLEIDGKTMLPADDTGYGFDNIADVLTISPGLLERYMLAASKVSRLAVGDTSMRPNSGIYEIPYLSLGQDERMNEALPFGSRGGVAIKHYFPLDGEYTLRFFLQRSDLAASYSPRGLDVANDFDIRLDRERVKMIRLGGKSKAMGAYDVGKNEGYDADAGVEIRFFAKAGLRTVGISMNKDRWLPEGVGVGRLPLTNNATALGITSSASYGRVEAGLDKVIITGPYNGGLPEDSVVRQRVFVCEPTAKGDDEACAKRILSHLARLAYRRPVGESDLQVLMKFFRDGKADGFDRGIQTALTRMLVDINFLFRPERDPQGIAAGAPYKLSDLEVASRLSFFLWSSIPDDELLTLAEQNKLRNPGVIEKQVRRMLADPKSSAMMESFFGQWLTTRNVRSARPDPKVFPDFDENLRAAFQEETKLFLESQVREDHRVPELLTANYTFVNDRLAKHYGIPGIEGNQFRRVTLPNDARAGLLGQGSVLMVTSYNDRTSVVVRGKFIMDTVFGTPPPPPPPNVPPLENTKIEGSLRQRMELHRKNPVCATCHNTIDPLGFAFENFDGTGKFRTLDSHAPIDPSGILADGTKFDGPASFRKAIVARQDAFLTTLTEKLLTYALGRGVETYDMPAVRKILRESARTDYRWSALVTEIVKSMPFQMRRAESL